MLNVINIQYNDKILIKHAHKGYTDTTEWLNWNELNFVYMSIYLGTKATAFKGILNLNKR